MIKTNVSRFTETVDYIQKYAASGLPQNIRNDIGTMINTRYPRTTPQQRQQYDQLSESMSVKRHIVGGVAKGTEAEREQRRAIVLLWSAMGATLPDPSKVNARLAQGMSLPPGMLPAKLTEVMTRAACVASNAGATHIFTTTFAPNPLAFIGQYRIFIHGTTLGSDTFKNPLAGNYRNVLQFNFYYNAGDDRFEFNTWVGAGYGGFHAFQTVSVPALHWSDVPGRGVDPVPTALNPAGFQGLLGTELAGANWMVTTQFTGCAFCYMAHAATPYAAHVSPAGITGKPVLTGAQLADQLMGNVAHVAAGDFANFPIPGHALQVFGNGAGNAVVLAGNAFYPPKTPGGGAGQMKWMSIFGKDNGGTWEIYTQAIDGVEAIMEHRRIF